jgi:hypothetical protein
MGRCIAFVAVAGCSFHHGAASTSGDASVAADAVDAAPGDGDRDAFVVSPDARVCFSAANVAVSFCLDWPPNGSTVISDLQVVDTGVTGSGPLQCQTLRSGSDVCVIAAADLQITGSGTLAALGPRPLVVLASTVTIDGKIDVGSHVRGRQGPASDLTGCNNGTNATGAGGGQGGSFDGPGGNGGNQAGQGSSHGTAGAVMTGVTTLRGGCPGGHGGGTGFSLGHGGGAVLVIADMLTIGSTGSIDASGGAGEAGFAGPQGAGGGGSGGMIAIVATTMALDSAGQIYANGGHGGGGATSTTNGSDGVDPSAANNGGSGGGGGSTAGSGAAGFPGTSRNGGTGGGGTDGGGGAGGGAGIVHITSGSTVIGNISPNPT